MSDAKALNMLLKASAFIHLLKNLKADFRLPNSSANSRYCAAVRTTQMTIAINERGSWRLAGVFLGSKAEGFDNRKMASK